MDSPPLTGKLCRVVKLAIAEEYYLEGSLSQNQLEGSF